MRKVAILTPGSYPYPSGSSSSVERVVENVAGLVSSRADIRVYGRRWPGQAESESVRGVKVERVGPVSLRFYVYEAMRRIAQFQPDIIQIENRPRYIPLMKRHFPHAHIWLQLHSTTFMHRQAISPAGLRRALSAADQIFVNSRYLERRVTRAYPGCREKTAINLLGVDVERFPSRWTEEGIQRYTEGKRARGWEGRDIVLYVGRLIPQKGVWELLQAVPRVIREHPRALFVIVGGASYGLNRKTAYVRRLERFASKYPHHIRMVPFVPHEEVPAWYALADLLAVPSLRREAFGLVNLEAMASGVPVVASRVGGIQEVVRDGETGLLVPPYRLPVRLASALVRLLRDREALRQMGETADRHVRSTFTWKQTAERWASFIDGLG
ncbi:glycosyltransferase family 4 protein [Paenibacillus dendritiformis]|uniref:glycosyltransferase family 4 protein n=1 Tax=Paenibacillus dendritiformis TaxID=130049 RepID=UPI000DA84A9D|nr:glycosyltransferase family 4 protein [Paenibacillus dendritiformis]PZM62014.1 glycosyltransferase family 1 protein [Paenibacillus dendritiformis]